MWGVEDEPQPAHAAIAPPGVHTDAVLTQPRLQALIHVYTHTNTSGFSQLSKRSDVKRPLRHRLFTYARIPSGLIRKLINFLKMDQSSGRK